MTKTLAIALTDSVNTELTNSISGILESGLDVIMDEGFWKEVPFISTAVSVYRIGRSLWERQFVKKLAIFLQEVNKGTVDEKQRKAYCNRLTEDEKKRNQELEYVLVLLDRYVNYEKPPLLAKLYFSYLNDEIVWEDFTKYAEIVERFLPGDMDELMKGKQENIHQSKISDSLLRLISYGFVVEKSTEMNVLTTLGSIIIPPAEVKNYEITSFGCKFLKIVSNQF